ncbi:MAG TPA: type II secretion system F family protein [Actinomycetota bacterium]|nr:type II secretion system F family protein [Actinomycetota bacterium]
MDVGTIGLLSAFGAAFLGFVAAGDVFLERHQMYKRLRSVREIQLSPTDVRHQELAKSPTERLLVPILKKVGNRMRRMAPASVGERLERELALAGSPPGWDAARILASKLLSLGIGVVAAFGLAVAGSLQPVQGMALAAIGAVVGYYLPEWLLRAKSGRRQDALQRALPDALDLLSITVEAGLAFDAALDRVAQHAGGPLGEEFNRVITEMRIGTSRADALRGLGERTTVPELRSFVMAMVQADVFGISIARVLQVQASEMRAKRKQRAEERAQKVPVKIVFPVLACIFPAMFLVILGPAVQQIYRSIIQ